MTSKQRLSFEVSDEEDGEEGRGQYGRNPVILESGRAALEAESRRETLKQQFVREAQIVQS